MKKHIFLYAMGLSFLAFGAHAQTADKTPEQRAQDLTTDMNCEIGLLGSQIPTVYAINLEAACKMDSIEATTGDDLKLLKKRGKMVDEARDEKLRDALTPVQFARYERISRGNKHALKATSMCRAGAVPNNVPASTA